MSGTRMSRRHRIIMAAVTCIAALLPATRSSGVMWTWTDAPCPLCQTKNRFWKWASYGGYIYFTPSRFQFIFWPYTDGNMVYCCKGCNLDVPPETCTTRSERVR